MTEGENLNPVISVVLAVRNAASTIADQLDALAQQDLDDLWELVVVDNGCTDATIAIVQSYADRLPSLTVADARDRAGLAHARNVGSAAAAAPLLACCDGDDVVAPDWLSALLTALGSADLTGGHLEVDSLNDSNPVYWRGGSPTGSGLPVAHHYAPVAIGANFAIRRDLLSRLGGCDEQFAICSDDVDLSWRAHAAGARVTFAPTAVVGYRLRPLLADNLRQQSNYGRAEGRLHKKFGSVMHPRPLDAARDYCFLLTRAHHLLRGPRLRGRWLCVVAYRIGRLRGALEQRTLWY